MAEAGRLYRLSILVDLQDRMQSAMEKVSGTTEKFEQKLKSTARAAQLLDRQKVAPVIDGRDRLTSKLNVVQTSLRSLTNKTWTVTLKAKDEVSRVTNKIGNAMASPLGLLGMGAATMGAGALITGSMSKAMDFESQLSSIKALTGATADEMDRIKSLALKLGADTKYSALEAAQGFEELLKAGLSVEQVENGGAEAALNLATAGGLGLAEAAEIMSTAMNAFKADGLSAAQAANILAGTANASATGVSELKFSLAAVSAVASGVGMSFQDVNAALGLFANNGLKGSDAGTSLKTMLMNLIPDTKKATEEFARLGLLTESGTSAFFNQEGHLKSLTEISDLLQTSMAGMTDEQRLMSMQTMFGSDAIRAANILYKEGADGVRKFNSEMMKVTALDVAKEKMNNAKGAIEQLAGSFETMQIRVMSPFLPLVAKIATGIGDSIDGATDQIVARAELLADQLNGFIDELAGDEKFQAMEWGDKIVYVLDRMIDAVDKWSSGPGGEQLGKVFTKLAEIGMRAWLAALGGMMKGSLNSLLSGNITGAVGLAMGANFLGAGALIKGGYGMTKGAFGSGAAAEGATAGPRFLPRLGDIRAGYDLMRPEAGRINALGSGLKMATEGTKLGGILETIGAQGSRLTALANSPLGGLFKRLAVPVGMAIDAFGVSQADDKAKAAGGMAGRWAGAWAGGKLGAAGGAAIGSAVPVVGTAAGALVGGIGGSIAGFFAGDKIGTFIGESLSKVDIAGPIKQKLGEANVAWETFKVNASAKLGEIKESAVTQFETLKTSAIAKFGEMKNGVLTWGSETSAAVSQFVDSIPEKIGYAVGYSLTWLSMLPERMTVFFTESYNAAATWAANTYDSITNYVGALPGRISAWGQEMYSSATQWASQTAADVAAWGADMAQQIESAWQNAWQSVELWASSTYASAVQWVSQTVTDTMEWFSSLPGRAETAWQGLYQAVDTWASNSYNSVVNWFSNIPSMISGYFDQAISNISAKASNLWSRMTGGYSAGQQAAGYPAHAAGGIFNTPHLALFAEEGAEAIIPLNPNRRARALEIWEQTGNALGVQAYADGGMTSSVAPSPLAGLLTGAAPQGGGGLTIENIDLSIVNDVDEEALALRIGRTILAAAKRTAENSAG